MALFRKKANAGLREGGPTTPFQQQEELLVNRFGGSLQGVSVQRLLREAKKMNAPAPN